MGVNAGFGALAQGFAGGLATRKADDERKAANARADAVLGAQLEIGRTNAEAARLAASRPIIMGGSPGYEPGGLGIRPTPAAGVSGDDDERTLLAKTLQAEAGGEGYKGMLAVGAVIGNRARSGQYGGNSLRGVIMAPGQFSAWNGVTGYAGGKGAIDMGGVRPSTDALRAADAILAGGYDDPTGGATHYYNPAVASPKWGVSAGGDWQTIGNHVFGSAGGRAGAHPTAPKRAAMRAEFPAYGGVPDEQMDKVIQHHEAKTGGLPLRGLGTKPYALTGRG